MINIYYIIFTSIIIWLIIPFRQLGNKYFYYFLFLAIMDPISIFFRWILNSPTNYFYIPLSFLALISLLGTNTLKKYRILIIILILIVFIMNFSYIISIRFFLFMSITHLLILFYFLKDFIVGFFKSKIFDIFLMLLIFYELTIVTKNLNLISGFADAHFYFFITSILEILIGLFFCFFKTDNPRFILQFK